jgi:transcription initiation factor TFIIIB Brf1 subunit/transcription initiation factor TFIIB
MESPQLLGTDGKRIVERCRECRGELVQAGEEVVCTGCGIVARRDFQLEVHLKTPGQTPDRRLGSYIGTKLDEGSTADFNGNSTVGYVKRLSDNLGQDQSAWHCSAMIRRAADKLSLPVFVRENAVAVSEKLLADRKENEGPRRRRNSVPAISAYAILSACRTARMDHVSTKSVLQTYANMGHKVTRSHLLRLGTESQTPLRPADPAALLRTVVGALESNSAVARKLEKNGTEPGQYFRRLLQASQTILGTLRSMEEGRNPRTLAAGSVYLASREAGPKAITQGQAAETLGVAEYTVREFVATVSRELGFGPLNGGSR